jgi:hypothetical protein
MTQSLIVSDPGVMMGKPVIAGTRITVEYVLEKLAAGESIDQVLEAQPEIDPRIRPCSDRVCGTSVVLMFSIRSQAVPVLNNSQVYNGHRRKRTAPAAV